MSDLLHKTLMSYHNDDPWDNEEEHPDGLLWLLTEEEWDDLPKGTTVESIGSRRYTKGKDTISYGGSDHLVYIPYGLRGYRD